MARYLFRREKVSIFVGYDQLNSYRSTKLIFAGYSQLNSAIYYLDYFAPGMYDTIAI